MSIDAHHKDYDKYVNKWNKINNVIEQENIDQYLIPLYQPEGVTTEDPRNKSYQERAVFYGLTNETIKEQTGMMFKKTPIIELPSELEYLKTNIDGRGNSIVQQSKRVAANVNAISRDGLFTTYPRTEGQVSKADINSGIMVATIQQIEASRIINWHETSIGSKMLLDLVVFTDEQETFIDYELKTIDTRRELFVEDGVYKQRIWIKSEKDDEWTAKPTEIPVDKNGNTFNEIQFDFIGSINNDPSVDLPNQLAMTNLEVAHYRNSADYEDNVWFIGQSQPWMSGINQNHVDFMQKNNMYIGSRNMIGVPSGERFGIDSAPPNPLVRQAMLDKVTMMISLGAKQVTMGGVAKTAAQTAQEQGSQFSVLTTIADNISAAYTSALSRAEQFMTGNISGDAVYLINTDFIERESTPAELKEMMSGYLLATVPPADYIRYMKRQKMFDPDKSDEDYLEELPVINAIEGDL